MASQALAANSGAGTIQQYAALRKQRGLPGGTRQAVAKAIKAGRLKECLRPNGILNFAVADEEWAAGRHAVPLADGKVMLAPGMTADSNVVSGREFVTAKARKEKAEAELAEIKLQKARGEVVFVADVQRAYMEIGKAYAAAREGLPEQLAPMLVGKTSLGEIKAILRRELRASDEHTVTEIEARFAAEAQQQKQGDLFDEDETARRIDGDGGDDVDE